MIRGVSIGNERACFARTPRRPGNAAMRSLSAVALRAMARRAPVRSAKETCHSTKRTHRFFDGKLHLSISDTMGYTIKFYGKSVGSFWETNPPGGVFWWGSVAATTTSRHLPRKYSVWRVVRLRSVGLGLENEPTGEGFWRLLGSFFDGIGVMFCGDGRGHDGARPSKNRGAIWIARGGDLGYKSLPARVPVVPRRKADFR